MNSLLAVFRFELKRIITPGRAVWWLLVAAFPVVITLLLRFYERPMPARTLTAEQMQQQYEPQLQQTIAEQEELYRQGRITERQYKHMQRLHRHARNSRRSPIQAVMRSPEGQSTKYTFIIYFLGPCIACMLGALLTAAPSVASELEQHSWTYLATRPNGLFHLVMGKYMVAVLWSASATLVGVVCSIPFSRILPIAQNGGALAGLALLSAVCYSALYMTIGTLFPKRAMVFCVAYTAAIELFMGMLPAVINRLTIQYRLRSLMFHWTKIVELPKETKPLFATAEGPLMQIFWLVAFAAVLLGVALTCVQVREFTGATEGDA